MSAEIPTDHDLSTKCPCQYGACGYCLQLGQHNKCPSERYERPPTPASYLCHRRGGHVLASVWEIGHDHRWVCDCARAGHGAKQRDTQLDLFSLVAS